MSDLVERVQTAILEQDLLRGGDSVLVAVSGGLDSMVLLQLMHRLAREYSWQLTVAHFNHQLRGRGSDADEGFVRQAAEKLGLGCEVGRANVRLFAKEHKLSIEMAARQLRHEFLARTAVDLGFEKVALGHQADDQLELFFLRLLRGAGLEGLSGMKAKALSPTNPRVELVRPLLSLGRAEIESFARETGIKFREDPSNAQGQYLRNRVRHELLPLLRTRFQPGLDTVLRRLMEIVAAESDFVAEKTRRAQLGKEGPFERWHRAIQRRWLRAECQRLRVEPDFNLIETLRTKPGTSVMITPETVAWRDETGQLHTRLATPTPFQGGEQTIQLSSKTGETSFDGVSITWVIKSRHGRLGHAPHASTGCESFDADKVGPTVHLRHWRAGDRFQPIGMLSPVKVQDLFVNKKISRPVRATLTVAASATGEIFWIEGLRISEQFKLGASTRHCLEWRWGRTETSLFQ